MHLAAARAAQGRPAHGEQAAPTPAPAVQVVGMRSVRWEVGRTVGVIQRAAG